jgi:hypothetical protein
MIRHSYISSLCQSDDLIEHFGRFVGVGEMEFVDGDTAIVQRFKHRITTINGQNFVKESLSLYICFGVLQDIALEMVIAKKLS